jgi:[protein-PII] uridylyltransferase
MAVGTHPAFVAMRDERGRLADAFKSGELDGFAFCRAMSQAMDVALREVWSGLEVPGTVSLVALGGYGRGMLAPRSDVDVMVLHSERDDVAEQVQPLFYALWDAGLDVGHAIRTPKECLKLAKTNLEAETSFLDMRLLAGDEGLLASLRERSWSKTRKRGSAFIDDVREMMRLRHEAHGSATSQLEPNIKEGTGGLRDIHVLDWFGVVVGDLVEEKLLDPQGRAEVDTAHELLIRSRSHLHLITGHHNDTLHFQQQRPVAEAMAYTDGTEVAEDSFMKDLFAATRAVELTVQSVAAEVSAIDRKVRKDSLRSGPFVVAGGRVLLEGELDLVKRPEDAIACFTLDAVPGAAAMRAVRMGLRDIERLAVTPPVRDAFLRLLRRADGPMLEMADHAGLFAALFPEWDRIRCRPQRNIYHRYTVDAHLFHAAEEAAKLLHSDDALVAANAADLGPGDTDLLMLAALFHDMGKGGDEDHSALGERLVEGPAERLGLSEDDAEILKWLVRNHLLLVDVATKRDLTDESMLLELVPKIGDERRLRLLYLLTVADGLATGPAAWGPWKASLINELAGRLRHLLQRGDLASADAARLARERRELAEELAGERATQVAAHLDLMGRAYLLAFEPEQLVRHAELAAAVRDGGIAAAGTPGDNDGLADLIVVAPDHPGLFSKVSGVLSLHGMSIVGGQMFTRKDGLALETFRCEGSLERRIDQTRWGKIIDDIERALKGRLSIESRLAEKRASYLPKPRMGKDEPPKVVCDNRASDQMTVVEVHAPDRLGLLYEITSALAECRLDIQVAKIVTMGDDVVDVFYLRDLDGQKIVDAEHLAEIERAVLHRIA